MKNKKILIPSDGTQRTEKVIDFICSIGNILTLNIVVVYIVEVPRDLPLHNSMPEQDAMAASAMSRAEEIALKYKVPIHTTKIFARNTDDCIVATAQEMKCDIVALAHENPKYKFIASPSMNIYQRAKCNVWLFNNK
jgi:nucleotide-binding universal stress UspA family protein